MCEIWDENGKKLVVFDNLEGVKLKKAEIDPVFTCLAASADMVLFGIDLEEDNMTFTGLRKTSYIQDQLEDVRSEEL